MPQNLPWQEADLDIQHPVSQWASWGVRAAHGKLAADNMPASLILPMGRHGPAFLAYPNFKVFLGWNSAYVYSPTVAYFATRLGGAPVVDHTAAKTVAALTTPQMMELQTPAQQARLCRRRCRRQARLGHAQGGEEGADRRPACRRIPIRPPICSPSCAVAKPGTCMMPSAGVPLFQTDLFVPRYRPMRHGAWELRVTGMSLAPGYWSQSALMSEMAVLLRDNASWMSLTPFEVESQEIGLRLAHGHVLICGLGMGWAAAVSALKEETTAVTVVERDAEVIALHRELDIFAQLPEAARGKIRVVQDDAFAYVPKLAVDVLMPDIWLPLVSEGRVDEVRRMQANVRAGAIYFWGQEMEIARHAAAEGRALDARGVAATVADFGLPLVGLERADYADKIAIVARRWMQSRWLPGTPPDTQV